MSGLKISYHKSEIFVSGATKEERAEITNLLNCRQGSLPFKYLGIPICDMMLYTANSIEV
jgi:hypothetical protein